MKSILIGDDNTVVRHLMRGLLEVDGCGVTEAADGLRAIAELQTGQFDAMFLDLLMPTLDGLGVLRAMKELNLRVYVILVTASDALGEVKRALTFGACDYLTKPFLLTDLRRTLSKATGYHFEQIQRTPTDVLLVDPDGWPLAYPHALSLLGEAAELESITSLITSVDQGVALIRVTAAPGESLGPLFFGALKRGDQPALSEVLNVCPGAAAWWCGNEVRAGRFAGPSSLANLSWWVIRHALETAMGHALSQSSKCVVSLSLLPADPSRLDPPAHLAEDLRADQQCQGLTRWRLVPRNVGLATERTQ
jgi:CheY-like chemotaxis protein